MSSLSREAASSFPTRSTERRSARSNCTNRTRALSSAPQTEAHAASKRSRLRARTMTLPMSWRRSCLVISAPMPPAPPVMTATLCVSGGQEERFQLVDWRNPNWWRRDRGFGIGDIVFFLSFLSYGRGRGGGWMRWMTLWVVHRGLGGHLIIDRNIRAGRDPAAINQ